MIAADFTAYLPVVSSAIVALSTLGAVYLTQRSARATQEMQLEAAAALDREKREDDQRREHKQREYETSQSRWEQRRAAYAEFLTLSEENLSLIAVRGSTLDERLTKGDALWAAGFRVMLLAPGAVTLHCGHVQNALLEVLNTRDGTPEEREAARHAYHRARRDFLREARRDLGTISYMGTSVVLDNEV